MQRIDLGTPFDPAMLDRVATLWASICYVVQRVLAILAVLGLTYGLIAAEVELAKIEQITEPVPR